MQQIVAIIFQTMLNGNEASWKRDYSQQSSTLCTQSPAARPLTPNGSMADPPNSPHASSPREHRCSSMRSLQEDDWPSEDQQAPDCCLCEIGKELIQISTKSPAEMERSFRRLEATGKVTSSALLSLKVVVVNEASRKNCVFGPMKDSIMDEYLQYRLGMLMAVPPGE